MFLEKNGERTKGIAQCLTKDNSLNQKKKEKGRDLKQRQSSIT